MNGISEILNGRGWCRRVRYAAVPVIMIFIFGSCAGNSGQGSGDGDGLTEVAVSIAPLNYFANAVGGDSVRVTTVMPRGADPETFEPGVAAMKSLYRADVLLTVGLLPFEHKLSDRVDGVRVRGVAEGVDLIYGTHDAGHHSAEMNHNHDDGMTDEHARHNGVADPHVWSSVADARIIANNVVAALSEADPERASYYRMRGKMLSNRLDSLAEVWGTQMERARGRAFVVWHPALSYFAREYGLRQIPLNIENKENSSLRLRDIMAEAKACGAVAMLIAKGSDDGQSVTVAEQLGLKPVEVDVMNPDWESEMQLIVDVLGN